jgi:hypothetical protein
MVAAHANVTAGMPFGTALTRNHVPSDHLLATENLEP